MIPVYAKALLCAYVAKMRDVIHEVLETDYKMLVYQFCEVKDWKYYDGK